MAPTSGPWQHHLAKDECIQVPAHASPGCGRCPVPLPADPLLEKKPGQAGEPQGPKPPWRLGMSSNAITTGAGQAPERKRNRRGFLAAGVATGLAALGLGRLASGDPAMATDGNPLIVGNYNLSSEPTYLVADGTLNATTLDVGNDGTGTGGTAIYAHTAATGGGEFSGRLGEQQRKWRIRRFGPGVRGR